MKAAIVQTRQLNGGGASRPPVRRMAVAVARSASTSSHWANISLAAARHVIAWSTADHWLMSDLLVHQRRQRRRFRVGAHLEAARRSHAQRVAPLEGIAQAAGRAACGGRSSRRRGGIAAGPRPPPRRRRAPPTRRRRVRGERPCRRTRRRLVHVPSGDLVIPDDDPRRVTPHPQKARTSSNLARASLSPSPARVRPRST